MSGIAASPPIHFFELQQCTDTTECCSKCSAKNSCHQEYYILSTVPYPNCRHGAVDMDLDSFC